MANFDINLIKEEIKNELQAFVDTTFPTHHITIYRHPYFNTASFPAINIETVDMYQRKVAIGGVKEKQLRLRVWIFVKIYDPDEAEALLNDIGMEVLEFIESGGMRKRTGLWDELDVEPTEERFEFGAVEDPENFLQGLNIPVYVKRRVVIND